ncbi:efflux RND transporter permease subunit [Bacteroidota bacterium]
MVNRLIKIALDNRFITLFAGLILTIAGAITAWHMEVDIFPDLTAPTVVVMTEASGMASEEVERLVTLPIEASVNGATNVRRVRSSSTTGFSVIWVEFDWGTDIYRARQIVTEKLTGVSGRLPEGVGIPTLGAQSSLLAEAMIIGLTADTTSLMELRTLADWQIRPPLLSIPGVAQITVIGGEIMEYQIQANPQKMNYFDVTLQELLDAVENLNINASGGILNQYGNEYTIRALLRTSDPAELGKAVIKNVKGIPVKIEDVAEVKIGAKSPKLGTASELGKPAVLLSVNKQPHTNTVELTKHLDQAVEEIQKTLPPDVHLSTNIFRQASFIENAIANVEKAIMEGALFLVIILFLFLNNWKSAVISLLALPLSLFMAILTLNWFGLTLNTMSLGGMAIAIGAMVDDAIIDVENVYRRIRENFRKPEGERNGILEVVYKGSTEIRSSIFNATLIIIVTFIPLFFLSGMEGRMLKPLGISFIVALFSSMLVAITVTPVLCSFWLADERTARRADRDAWIVRLLKRGYAAGLARALNNRWKIVSSGIVLFAISLVLLFSLGRSFLPPFNEGSMTIMANTQPGISLEESDKLAQLVEQELMKIPEAITVARKTGRAELDEHALGTNGSEIEVPFELTDRNRDEVFAEARERLSAIRGISVEVGQPISHRIDHMLSGTRSNIAIKVFGDDLNRIYGIANSIRDKIADVRGLADLNVEMLIERPQLQIKPRREMLARFGISTPEFAEFVDVALAGKVVSQVYEGVSTFDITVKYDQTNRADMEAIRNIPVDTRFGLPDAPTPHGDNPTTSHKVPLYFIADVVSGTGPNTINRENMQRKIVVSANVAGRDLRSTVNEIKEIVSAEINLPEGYRIEYGGQFESEEAASQILFWSMIGAILVVFLILFQEFKKFKTAGIIMMNLPLALIGGVFTVVLTTGEISIPVIIGFISLFGIATRNGILLVSRYEHLREDGIALYKRVLSGSLDRLNPIVMTALCAALGMLPLALGSDLPGNEIQSPMAKVILGGLLTSTLLNLFFIPVIYSLVNRKKG